MSLYKRGGVFWSYVWVDGVRHAKSTQTANRRKAEDIDQKHKEELRLKNLNPDFAPEMPFAELAARFLGSGSSKAWHTERLEMLLPYFADFSIGKITKGAIRRYREERHRKKLLSAPEHVERNALALSLGNNPMLDTDGLAR